MVLARGVKVNIAGVYCTLRVVPPAVSGVGRVSAAVASRRPSAAQRIGRGAAAISRSVPRADLIVSSRDRGQVLALPANWADRRFEISQPVTVQLAEDCDLFDVLAARYDGGQFWFDQVDPRADPASAAYLRRELTQMTEPQKLARLGLTDGQRRVYAAMYQSRTTAILADQRHRGELRLTAALAQAGATFRDFNEAGDTYRVSFAVDGRRHTSVVRKDDLSLLSAGICLSGQDRVFDLNSLVGVLREGAADGQF